jgi:4-carboxymuconolactone decarboxylase
MADPTPRSTPRSSPRIPPLTDAECTADQLAMLEPLGPNASLNIFRTLVRHPKLFRRWSPFAGRLLQASTIGDRNRELVILRVAWRCGGAYEWGQHVGIARTADLSDEEIARVATELDGSTWSDDDATLLRAVDELQADHCISDSTWATLADRFGEEQLIEITMLAGAYAMLAGTLNSLGVQLEGDQPALGQV